MHSPFVSNPAARPTAFGNRIPMTHTGFSGAVGAISAFKPKTVNQSRLFKTRRCALCALRQSSIFLTVAKRIGTHPENRANVSFFLTNKPLFYRITNSYRTAGWSSLVARRAHNPKVGGSNPSPATKSSELLFGEVFCIRKVFFLLLRQEKVALSLPRKKHQSLFLRFFAGTIASMSTVRITKSFSRSFSAVCSAFAIKSRLNVSNCSRAAALSL